MGTEYRYGVVPADAVKDLSGLEVLRSVIDGRLPQATICQHLTFWITEVGDGWAVFEGETGPHLLNPMGTVHGGWALAMIDSAAGCAAHSQLPAGAGYTTVETKANFARPILPETGRVRCEGRVVARGRQIVSAEAKVTGADGKVLAHGTSTVMILGPRA